ncbi:hypothetical protein BD310DRAFT_912890 [Dichomitus squalens]|uniref:Uncharacterized protein n=1 Tax=Dichomitus squalens TaxID=114155 RepID=A0A4Q9QE99_9APHY|nr:hypothetical protein BD310DRAFT_912890 [Dichomitus squalens]
MPIGGVVYTVLVASGDNLSRFLDARDIAKVLRVICSRRRLLQTFQILVRPHLAVLTSLHRPSSGDSVDGCCLWRLSSSKARVMAKILVSQTVVRYNFRGVHRAGAIVRVGLESFLSPGETPYCSAHLLATCILRLFSPWAERLSEVAVLRDGTWIRLVPLVTSLLAVLTLALATENVSL